MILSSGNQPAVVSWGELGSAFVQSPSIVVLLISWGELRSAGVHWVKLGSLLTVSLGGWDTAFAGHSVGTSLAFHCLGPRRRSPCNRLYTLGTNTLV